MSVILDTGVKNAKNVQRYFYGKGALGELEGLLKERRQQGGGVLFFVDEFFRQHTDLVQRLPVEPSDRVNYVGTADEPETGKIDALKADLVGQGYATPAAIVGIGGGITLDTAKAISNLMTNPGKAEQYQGWDLVKKPGIYKIGIPTLSGTGAEATRTCVITNKKTGLKLGMNSDFTVYDQLILDPLLTETVPVNQYFYSGMDAYIHCLESLAGSYRNAIGDAFSEKVMGLCSEVFLSDSMMTLENREKMMVASYLGGCAIATSYVGVVHPFSAGLSVALGLHHCVANCITMRGMQEFYPREYDQFWEMVDRQGVSIPEKVCADLSDEMHQKLYESTVVHEKPLTNALGVDFKSQLTPDKVRAVFEMM